MNNVYRDSNINPEEIKGLFITKDKHIAVLLDKYTYMPADCEGLVNVLGINRLVIKSKAFISLDFEKVINIDNNNTLRLFNELNDKNDKLSVYNIPEKEIHTKIDNNALHKLINTLNIKEF